MISGTTLGYLLLLTSLTAFGLLGIFHKVADHPNCRPKMIAVILLFWGGVLTTLYTLQFDAKGLQFPPKVLLIGSAGGIIAGLALFVFQTGLKFGKISTSWLIINLSMSIPILLSVFLYHEKITPARGLGVVLVFAAIVMMWWDKKADMEKADPDKAVVSPKNAAKWLPLMLLSFLGNGLAASSQKVLVESGVADYTWQFYITLYWSGFLLMVLLSVLREARPNSRELITGFVMAICSVAGNVSITLALGHKVPGAIAYPVGNGGSLTLVVLAGVLFFREKMNRIGMAGIFCGICAILILVIA